MMTDQQLFDAMEKLPDEVADALNVWRKATIERESLEAKLFIEFKSKVIQDSQAFGTSKSDNYTTALLRADNRWVDSKMVEAAAEVVHTRLYERLMGVKKTASIRAGF